MHFKLNIRRYSPISHFHKIVNIMRLSLVLCMLTIFCASATVSYSQVNEISLHLEDATLEQALEAIKQQSEYSFWYRNDEINLGRKVSVNINNQNIANVLDRLLATQGLAYTINEKHIVIYKTNEKASHPLITNNKKITGKVTDEKNEPIIGANVVVKGSTTGTITDMDGNFTLEVPDQATLLVSYIGYPPLDVAVKNQNNLSIMMIEDSKTIDEVVVIGYGSVKKSNLTGAVSSVKTTEIQHPPMTSIAQGFVGRASGVQVTQTSGMPGAVASIRVRGSCALLGGNEPLYVIDGFPVYSGTGFGSTGGNTQISGLSTVNPSDIESIEILKDASATAIYGSRASNGVIIITTKKGGSKALKVEYSRTYSANVNSGKVPVLDADEFRAYIDEYYPENTLSGAAVHKAINYTYPDGTIGYYNTDWQKEIYRIGLSTDQNIGISGGGDKYPFRVSLGYTDQNGTLKGSNFQSFTQAVTFTPKFFDKHLSVSINLKATENKNKYVSTGAINAAAAFDPTKPVHFYNADGAIDYNKYNGYFQWLNPDGSINRNGSENPVSRLSGYWDETQVFRSFGNMQLDYSFHFLPELRANLNLGYDYTKNDGDKGNYPGSYSSYTDAILPPGQGRYTDSKSTRENYLLDFYLNYVKDIKAIRSKIDVMAGYSWQHFKRDDQSQTYSNPLENYESVFISESAAPKEYYLISLFGRLNYTFMDKYLITFTLRDDGTSRFSPSNRWGLFPSVALAWRMSDEAFFKKFDKLSNLKLRASYGVTGQQNIGSDYYPYIATYNLSTITSTSQYQIGDKFYQILKPEAYNENIKWESTATWNVALDWGFFNNRLSGSVDLFYKETSDLLNSIPIPAGSNFTNKMTANIGNLENKGVEININATPIVTKDFSWDIGVNATWSKSKITKLTAIFNPDYVGVPTGGISMGTGNNIQIHSVGYAPNTFYVYEQVYDEYGNPVQDAFIDQNKDGFIDDKDLVLKQKSRPDVIFGFNMLFRYKNWDFGFNAHGSIGNWVFNDYNSARCSADYTFSNGQTVRNIPEFVVKTSKFRNPITVTQAKSDLFLENASFLKVDNITLGYSFKKLFNSKLGGRVSFTAQNPFVITKYSGLDPEVSSGIDNNAWPRPRIFVLGLNLKIFLAE